MSSFHLFVFLVLLVPNTCTCTKKFLAILVFGDSTVDPGNNNFINTIFKSNHGPYGLNFPGQVSSGRFSDGKLITDMVASALKIKSLIPPYLQPNLSDDDLRTGVSFASAGSGYDEATSTVSGVIPIKDQVMYFREYKEKLRRVVGDEEAIRIISGALVMVSAGTNDFIFSFYDFPTRRLQFNIDGYQDFLLSNLQSFIKELYRVGCRIITVAGVPPIGCLPVQIASKGPFMRSCVEEQNHDSQVYNEKLAKLLPQLQKSLPGSKVLYADVYKPLADLINSPKKYGFVESRIGCCGLGIFEAGPTCLPITPLCSNPSRYLFFDSIHPTEFTYHYIADDYLNKQILPQITADD